MGETLWPVEVKSMPALGYSCPSCGAEAAATQEVMSFVDGSCRDIGVVGFCSGGCGWAGQLG